MELILKSAEENTWIAQNQEEYNKKHDALVARFEALKKQLDGVNDEIQARKTKRDNIKQFIADLQNAAGPLKDFDEPLWYATVDTVTIGETTAAFAFKNGMVIETDM